MSTSAGVPDWPVAPIACDVLIIGGGVQGLWLLNDLRSEGYSALLLERRALGDGQTCHSHVYLHQGHLYRDVGLAMRLKEITPRWREWLARRSDQRLGVVPSYFGFANPADARTREALWNDPRLGLNYRVVTNDPPRALAGGAVRVVLESAEVCLDGRWLVSELRRGVDDWISQVEQVRAIALDLSRVAGGRPRGGQVEEVVVTMPGGPAPVRFQPSALVLAAGAGNQTLLLQATGGNPILLGRLSNNQQLRLAYMLVIRGPSEELPPLTGVFPDLGGLFQVSRRLADSDEVVWLVSDQRSQMLTFVEDWIEFDASWWLRAVLSNLERLAPRLFGSSPLRGRFQWGIYAAPKAEGRSEGAIPLEERIEQFGIENLWTLWPTKLTLAPKVSQDVVAAISQQLGAGSGSSTDPPGWQQVRCPVATAVERWQKAPLVSWDQFQLQHGLP
jgi:glycine/D-amino acid oxidase-like deaminating enzyme